MSDRDITDEIRGHLEEKVQELMAHGLPREEADARARREFGNVMLLEERSREVWRWSAVEQLAMDARYAFRQLRRAPAFAFARFASRGSRTTPIRT